MYLLNFSAHTLKHQVAFYKLWKFHFDRFKPERILARYLRKFGQILICEKKATEGFAANAGLFVCLSHSFWQSKQYPFSMFTLTNHTWAGKLGSRWHAEDNTNNNNMAICCAFNILVHKKPTATLVFQISICDANWKKKGKPKNASQRNSNSKKGKRGESVAAKTPEGETPQDALTMWFPWGSWNGTREIHWVGFTLLKVGKLAVW